MRWDLASLLKRFSTEKETEEIAIGVNQWRFRTVFGKIFNCDFFQIAEHWMKTTYFYNFFMLHWPVKPYAARCGASYAMQVEITQGFLNFCEMEHLLSCPGSPLKWWQRQIHLIPAEKLQRGTVWRMFWKHWGILFIPADRKEQEVSWIPPEIFSVSRLVCNERRCGKSLCFWREQ